MLDNASPDGHTDLTERDADIGDPASPVSDELAPEYAGDEEPSLGDDITALVDDGKAYVQAELAFQKSRAAFAAGEVKAGTVFALGMLAFLHLALIGLVVGLILSLAPIVGPLGATGIVVGVLLLGMALLGWLAVTHFKKISRAFDDGKGAGSEDTSS